MSRQRWRKDYEQPRYTTYNKATKPYYNSDLYNARIIQRNLVYVIGLAPEISNERILKSSKYFGQYGKIEKVVVKNDKPFNPRGIIGPTYSAYITFSNDKEASLAILAIDEFELHERIIKASYGTTKYCTFFLRNQSCPNRDCLYLHKKAKQSECFPKDLVGNKAIFREQQQSVLGHLSKYAKEIFKGKSKNKSKECVFPLLDNALAKLKSYCEENNVNFGPSTKTVKTLSSLAQWDMDEEDKVQIQVPIREPILLKKKSSRKKSKRMKRKLRSVSKSTESQQQTSKSPSIDTPQDIIIENVVETPEKKRGEKDRTMASTGVSKSMKKSKSGDEKIEEFEGEMDEDCQRKSSINSLIPENLIENFSPLDKLLLSKFQTISEENRSSSHHQESCLKIVSLIKNFLVEEQNSERKKNIDHEFGQKGLEMGRGKSEGRGEDKGFKLFNQNYVLRIKRENTRLDKIKLGRTKSHTHKDKDGIRHKTRKQRETSYSYKSK